MEWLKPVPPGRWYTGERFDATYPAAGLWQAEQPAAYDIPTELVPVPEIASGIPLSPAYVIANGTRKIKSIVIILRSDGVRRTLPALWATRFGNAE